MRESANTRQRGRRLMPKSRNTRFGVVYPAERARILSEFFVVVVLFLQNLHYLVNNDLLFVAVVIVAKRVENACSERLAVYYRAGCENHFVLANSVVNHVLWVILGDAQAVSVYRNWQENIRKTQVRVYFTNAAFCVWNSGAVACS